MTGDGIRLAFGARYGARPEGVWAAPGRVNLIGEHTDYNGGLVLPLALPCRTRVAVRRRTDGVLRLSSAQVAGPPVELRLDELRPGAVHGWAGYPAGVLQALRAAGHPVGGLDLHVDSDVPLGAGLSSSAALECATALALNDLHGLGLGATELALLAQRAENEFVGVPCGAMDQLASACCQEGHALLIDTRDLTLRQLPLDLAGAGMHLLVLDTRTKHDLGDGAYAALRAGCERAAALLGLPALRDLHPDALAPALAALPGELRPLVRHVVTENARVEQAATLLDTGSYAALGPLLTAGHASLRDDYRVSWPQADLAVSAALSAGAHGARMTGGGFGGSVLVLVDAGAAPAVATAVGAAFRRAGYELPRVVAARPSTGACRLG
ncbi:galactokinase [Kitasatospora viridis]|uniref:Galactokinase n=1 Tax=Kitasatospora viridis TaxID=281105 RepID=A0A561TWS8_9ACTN|nr:galactokinase [Kitasatospora viridis]TWF91560.1 galactokinase [Kitasatospora viridis]